VSAAIDRRRVGFVGLGAMGLPMADVLRAAGVDLRVYDAFDQARTRAAEHGHRVTPDLATLISESQVLIAMLPDTPQVDEIIHGEGGIMASGSAGLRFVDMSSISPISTKEFAQELAERGIVMVDGPVSGGVEKASVGELSIMAGGTDEHLDAVAPFLDLLGKVTRMGPVGSGQATKVCNQVAVTLTMIAAAEAFALGSKLGVDLGQLHAALMGGSCASFILENLAPKMLAGEDAPGGLRIALQVKDLKLAREAAIATSTPLPGSSVVLDLYLDAMANGQAADGNQAISRVYERRTGAVIATRPPSATR
jgi:2-hydroxy-3-oxopropionate reductase